MIGATLTAVAALALLPAAILFLQVVASLPARRAGALPPVARPRVGVLVPAHDESAGIAASLASIRSQLVVDDRLLVVADNCSDDTARIARAAGAEAIERHDAARRGKGYALDYGVRHFAADPPEVVIVVDADCLPGPGAIDALARRCAASGSPAQALDLMQPGGGAPRPAHLAWRVRNLVRPLGMLRLGLPCQLMGTGMAFPWRVIRDAPLASGDIVEDLALGLELARRGQASRLCPEASVSSHFPESAEAAWGQRRRWEHGHLALMLRTPRLLASALLRGNLALLALVLDLLVPPLSLLLLSCAALVSASLVLYLVLGAQSPLVLSISALALLTAAVLLSWLRHGRDLLSFESLLLSPLYALRKIPLYAGFLAQRQTQWVRSKRGNG